MKTPDAASGRGSMKPGPSEDYKALLRGEIACEEYVRRLKADVDQRLVEFPSSAETVAGGGSEVSEACTDSAHDLAEWVCATIDYLVLDEPRPTSLDEYVSKPTLARKAKDKVLELARRAA